MEVERFAEDKVWTAKKSGVFIDKKVVIVFEFSLCVCIADMMRLVKEGVP